MIRRYSYFAYFALLGLGVQAACSAQGDQPDTGLSDDGNSGSGPGNGGTIGLGGTSSSGGTAGVISVGGTIGSGGTLGSGGTQGGIQCVGNGAGLRAIIRDFQPTWMGVAGHPDFEPHVTKPSALSFYNMLDRGIVQPQIDPVSRKPIYAGPAGGTNTTNGPQYFQSWFTDTEGVNVSIEYVLPFVEEVQGSGIYVFNQSPFLPIDDGKCPVEPQTPCLLGNSRNYPTHNYALTLEFHTKFVYKPGLSFLFSGDDDVWVFVNGSLAIDLGGIHQRAEARLNLDQAMPALEVGKEYILDFFWADRHVTDANFRVETSLDFINCSIDVPK